MIIWVQGVIAAIRDGFGFIKCVDRDARMFFHFSEVLEETQLHISDEVEFTVVPVGPVNKLYTKVCIIWNGLSKCTSTGFIYTPLTARECKVTAACAFQDMLSAQRNHAVRIKKLPKGTVSFHTQSEQRFVGVVEKEVAVTNKNASPTKGKEKVPPGTNVNKTLIFTPTLPLF